MNLLVYANQENYVMLTEPHQGTSVDNLKFFIESKDFIHSFSY